MSTDPTATAAGRCGSCKHWVERDDYSNIGLDYRPEDREDGYKARVTAQHEADKLYKRCAVITLGNEVDRDNLPLAFTLDASEYVANLMTQATFGCVLWEATDGT